MVVTVDKLWTDDEGGSYRPNTTAKWWQLVEGREVEFVIEILDERSIKVTKFS